MTVTSFKHEIPCIYAKGLMGILGLLLALLVYVKADVASVAAGFKSDHDKLIELTSDVKYIRQAVDQLAARKP